MKDEFSQSPTKFEQLALSLGDGFEEELVDTGIDLTPGPFPEGKGSISTEERARRSEGARLALEAMMGIGEGTARRAPTMDDPEQTSPEPSPNLSQGERNTPEWFGTYLRLREFKIPWRVAVYVAWASVPKVGRWPKTQDELARQVLGLNSDRVIATWRKKSPDIDEVIAMLQSAPLMEYRADVFKALAESAAMVDHRSNPDRKLFLEMTGDYVPRQQVDVKRSDGDNPLAELSDEELRKAARAARGEKDD